MAKNKSDQYVHVHTEAGTVVVGPGEDFPDGADVDPGLTDASSSDEPTVVAGPSQGAAPADSGVRAAWKDVTTAQIRAALATNPAVTVEDGDRKDALIQKATDAGVSAADVSAHVAATA